MSKKSSKMLNKKKFSIIVAIVVVIIAIIAIVICTNQGSKTSKLYNKLLKEQVYMFSMKDDDNYDIAIAKKQDKACIESSSGEEKTSIIVKDGQTYSLIHSQKEYYMYDQNIAEDSVITDTLATTEDIKPEKGTEEINGTKYKYEEFTGFSGFMTSTSKEVDDADIKTRFYYDGGDLVYIKTIVGEEEELLQVSVSYDVQDELFEIPSDYAQVN